MTKTTLAKLFLVSALFMATGLLVAAGPSSRVFADNPPGCYQNGKSVDCKTDPGNNDFNGKPLSPTNNCYIPAIGPVPKGNTNWQPVSCGDLTTRVTPNAPPPTGGAVTPDCAGTSNPTSGPASGCISNSSDPAANCNPNQCDLVGKYLNPAISLLSGIVGLVIVASIVAGGVQYSTSEGDPQKVAKAKGRIMNAVFALLGFAFVYAFLQFIIPGGVFKG